MNVAAKQRELGMGDLDEGQGQERCPIAGEQVTQMEARHRVEGVAAGNYDPVTHQQPRKRVEKVQGVSVCQAERNDRITGQSCSDTSSTEEGCEGWRGRKGAAEAGAPANRLWMAGLGSIKLVS